MKKLIYLFFAVLIATIGFISCGGGEENPDSGNNNQQPTDTTTVTPQPEVSPLEGTWVLDKVEAYNPTYTSPLSGGTVSNYFNADSLVYKTDGTKVTHYYYAGSSAAEPVAKTEGTFTFDETTQAVTLKFSGTDYSLEEANIASGYLTFKITELTKITNLNYKNLSTHTSMGSPNANIRIVLKYKKK